MIVIQIVDWRSYLIRPDLKKHSFFKLSTGLFTGPKIWELSADTRLLFLLLLDLACQANDNGFIKQTPECLVALGNLNSKNLEASLQHLEKIGIIEICEKSVENLEKSGARPARKSQKKPMVEIVNLTDEELDLGRKWLEMAVSEMPHRANETKWNPGNFAEDLVAVKKAINLNAEQMTELFNWIANSHFWRPLACAPLQLLKKKEGGVCKVDTILAQMKKPFERKMDMAREAAADPNRPLTSGGTITMNTLRKLNGLPPLGE